MKKVLLSILISVGVLFAANQNNYITQNNGTIIAPDKIVVKYKQGTQPNSINKSAKIQIATRYNLNEEVPVFKKAKNASIKKRLNLQNVFVYDVALGTDVQSLAKTLSKDKNVEYAEPVYLSRLEATPNDPLYSSQQHLPQINAPEAWDDQYGSSSVIIGVIDSGVDWDHEDLADIIWSNSGEIADNGIDDDGNGYIDDIRGWDFVADVTGSGDSAADPNEDGDTPDNDPMDYDGHGTHVSGIAAGETNNSIGIASVSSGARVMPLRCGWHGNDGNGYVSSTYAAEAYMYAADNGASVTNQSSGNSGQLIVDGAFYAFLNGVLIVESAGNSNNQSPSVLGAQPWVISVASLDSDDGKSSFSNYGEYIDVSAPGSSILSTIVEPSPFFGGNKYTRLSGTSMAAPLVASVAGLVMAKYPAIDVIELYTKVVETAENIDAENPAFIDLLGSGKVNAQNALSQEVTAYPRFEVLGTSITETSGNSNGILEPGEEARLNVEIQNMWAEGSNLTATLSSSNSWPITITNNLANITSIASLLDTNDSITTLSFDISCDANSIPSTVSMQLDFSATSFSQTINFEFSVEPQLLFVADFEQANDEELDFSSLYFDDFKSQKIAYDYVHTLTTDITYDLLSKYDIVVWACEWNFPSLSVSDRDAVEQYLDNGGALFISGQDIGWELSESDDNTDIAFFNNYLKATYLADDAGKGEIFGVEGDPISDGLSSEFFQIRRTSSQQYPDQISPLDGAVSLFEYDDATTGAIRYSGDYDLVYFSFGGYESILNEDVRRETMRRIVNWFAGVTFELQTITDTENTSSPISVGVNVTSESTIESVKLFYDTDGEFPYNSVSMASVGGDNYQGEIPAQSDGSDVTYFVQITLANGKKILTNTIAFYVGADIIAPVVEELSNPIRNTINAYGIAPFNLKVGLTDNLVIDTSTAELHYWVNDGSPETVTLTGIGENQFEGTFGFDNRLMFGDNVSYYFSVNDKSVNTNLGVSDTTTFTIDTTQVIDDFELPFFDWETTGNWGLSTTSKTGEYSLSDSPSGQYGNNENSTATYKLPLNLSIYIEGEITYYVRSFLEAGVDSLLFELSSDDGTNWQIIDFVSQNSIFFSQRTVDISSYVGTGYDNVKLRFRLSSNGSTTADGAYVDDIVINVTPNPLLSVDDLEELPQIFELSQNYPNPFNPSTTIKFAIPVKAEVNISVYNVLGQLVDVLANETMNAGTYSVNFDGSNKLSSGVYMYRISANGNDGRNFVQTKKMILIK